MKKISFKKVYGPPWDYARPTVIESCRITRPIGSLSDLARIDPEWTCVMVPPSKRQLRQELEQKRGLICKRMKTPNLFEVPQDRPTRKQRLEAFKAKHAIWTYHSIHLSVEDEPWNALLVFKAQVAVEEPNAKPMELISGYCSILEEMNLLLTGKTEADAIRVICERNDIPFDP